MTQKTKRPFPLWKEILFVAISLVLSLAMLIGTVVAYNYSYILDVFFSQSDYVVSDAEKAKCEEVAAEGIVLLQNKDDTLPLKKGSSVAFLGQDSADFVYGGSGSGSVDTTSAPTMKDSFERAGFIVDETVWNFYTNGAGKDYRKDVPTAQGSGSFKVNEVPADKYTDEMKNSLSNNDAIFCVIGRSGGESFDLPLTTSSRGYELTGGEYLYLQVDDNERAMIQLACSKSDKVILIVNSNNAMELGFLEDAAYQNVKSVLWVPGVGQEGLYALGDIAVGNVNPSGRLVDTYAYDSLSAPANANLGSFSLKGVTFPTANSESTYNKCSNYIVYAEGIYIGYKYYETRYEDYVLNQGNAGTYDYASTVQYPFGYGLSYTDFTWSDFTVKETGDAFEISVKVTNTGSAAGKDVVEIYMQSPYTEYDKQYNVEKSSVELVGFAKTSTLKAKGFLMNENEYSEVVTVTVDKEVLRAYDYTNAKTYIVDNGQYYFTAATDAHNAVNNILAKKAERDSSILSRMAGTGDASLVDASYAPATFDKTTYSTSLVDSSYTITNQFDTADVNYYESGSLTYLTRKDWTGTMPATYKDGTWNVSDQLNDDLNWNRSAEVLGTNNPSAVMPTNSSGTSYTIADAIGKDYDDPIWDALVNQVSVKKMLELVRCGGYQTISLKAIELPSTIDKDGPSGISGTLVGGTSCMAWPVEVMMSATWNTELIEEMGILIGDDSISAGVAGWYAPGADIHRSPYSGRNFEYYSEDGFLSGKIGAAEVRGVRARGVIAYMKHFALNDQETGRSGGAVFSNEQAIREIYLKGFEYIATEGGVTAAMAAMNRIGPTWAGAHKGLMTEVLRNEWGFRGMVITDQASVSAMFYEDIISGLWAGNDMWLNTSSSFWNLDDFYTGATSNPTIMQSVHVAAKNIIYAVVNSNAVLTYDDNGELEDVVKPSTSSVFPWRTLLITVDCIIWAASIVGIVLPTILFVRDKKRAKEGYFDTVE